MSQGALTLVLIAIKQFLLPNSQTVVSPSPISPAKSACKHLPASSAIFLCLCVQQKVCRPRSEHPLCVIVKLGGFVSATIWPLHNSEGSYLSSKFQVRQIQCHTASFRSRVIRLVQYIYSFSVFSCFHLTVPFLRVTASDHFQFA